MPPDERDTALLWRMEKAARDAAEISSGLTFESLTSSLKDQLAVTKAIERIGEAAYRISAEFRDAHPELPWRLMIGMRHRLVHEYEATDWEIVWRVLQESIPELLRTLPPLVPPPPASGDTEAT